MSRPAVSVVMPFAGSGAEAEAALRALLELDSAPGDELILADNGESPPDSPTGSLRQPGAGDSVRDPGPAGKPAITVVRVGGERSPSHARNAGAERAGGDWLLFLDADCHPEPGLIQSYFATPIDSDVGALAGEVVPAVDGDSFAERYGAARSFLGQATHLAHPYMPRAVAANLLVRRRAFDQVGGFYEGVRAAEDTDFSWRLQRAGWRLVARPQARVEHRYRPTVRALRRQWRGYAAGRAWLGRRYEDFEPEPAIARAASRSWRIVSRRSRGRPRAAPPGASTGSGRLERGRFLALDALLGLEELAGITLSNRPRGPESAEAGTRVVLVAERFPARGDPLGDFARTLAGVRVEAAARPEAVDTAVSRELRVDYREDDGAATRAAAVLRLIARHPLRSARDVLRRASGAPGLAALAPAVFRLAGERDARVYALGGDEAAAVARRLAALGGRRFADEAP